MSAYLSPLLNDQQADANGAPLSGGRIYTYVAGTSTPIATYIDADGLTAQSNPIVLNSAGRPDYPIWLPAGQAVKLVLKTSADVSVDDWDNVTGINDPSLSNAVDQWVTFAGSPSYINATSFSVAGDQTGVLQVGRRVKLANTGGTVYSSIGTSTYNPGSGLTTVTLQNSSGSLDSGLSQVGYGLISAKDHSLPAVGAAQTNGFRLTLTSGQPVTTADVSAASTLYACPYKGNEIALYTAGGYWSLYETEQFSLALSGLVSDRPYDVFCHADGGSPALEVLAWTNDTSRATALSYQDGVLVKSGDATRRYLGTFYTTSATTTEDSAAKRYLWNYYHRVRRSMRNVPENTASWTYTTSGFRQARASTSNQLNFVIGVAEDGVQARVLASAQNTSAGAGFSVAVGLNSTIAMASGCLASTSASATTSLNTSVQAHWTDVPAAGRHFLAWLETSDATGTTTWYGTAGLAGRYQSGIQGEMLA